MQPKKSLKQKILDHLQSNSSSWHNGGSIEDFIRQTEFRKASNASRRCRELAEEGLVERKIEKKTVWYRFKPQTVFNEMVYSKEFIERQKNKQGVLI